MCWMSVDLHQLAQQKEGSGPALPGQPGQRTLRRMGTSKSKSDKRQGNR